MGDYNRSTKECTLQTMHPRLATAIRIFCETKELGDIEQAAIVCIETTNQKKKDGLLGGAAQVQSVGAVLTPTFLVWAISEAKGGTSVIAAKLREIEAREYKSDRLPDTGLDIFGFINDAPERVSVFIGLGSEPAAQRFSEAVRLAVAQAKA